MARNTSEKKRLKRKVKKKQKRVQQTAAVRGEKAEYLRLQAEHLLCTGYFEQALGPLADALAINPNDSNLLNQLAYVGQQLQRLDIELKASRRLYRLGMLDGPNLPHHCNLLCRAESYEEAAATASEILASLPGIKLARKREIRAYLKNLRQYALDQHARQQAVQTPPTRTAAAEKSDPAAGTPTVAASGTETRPAPREPKNPAAAPVDRLPELPITVDIDLDALDDVLSRAHASPPDRYELALAGYRVRLNETFDHLVCLNTLRDVRSLWYQEETAKKVLKRFRGRALLADEVGLGKTIEALMVFSEYYRRGMVKSGLILTPTPLVSQWQQELRAKFDFEIPSTDDTDYRRQGPGFWQQPFVLASINQAKSKRNFARVTAREYDLVIVDEAHHLKNRNTLNWKLVNALKKKYLLMLTATPVENNLLELYNLITLLKPGQLKTASAFRAEFMTRGDPTDPRNRAKLKTLLGEVMIRNTRALANIDIPPRVARTIRIDAGKGERELYERISGLVRRIAAEEGTPRRMLLKNLLAQAGSSPQAVRLSLERLLAKGDLPAAYHAELRAIDNLCRSMGNTRKNDALLELIRRQPGKLIVFVKFTGSLEHLVDVLDWERIPHAVFHGRMSNAEKDRQIESFRQDAQVLLTTEIGGEGRNLQFCHQMVNYDLPWNPMRIEQRIGRIHRLGQEKEVRIYNFCGAGSIEDYILDILDRKINMFEMVIGEIDMILGRIRGESDFSDLVYDIWVNTASDDERRTAFNQLGSRMKRSKTSYEKTKQLDDALFGENYEL